MKRKLLAYMGLLIFAGLLVAAVMARNLPEWPSQAVTKGGDQVIFNRPTASGMLQMEPYNEVDEKAYRLMEPDGQGLGVKAILPENAENTAHGYRYTLDENHEMDQLHDEVWNWETPVYPDGRAAVSQNTGRQQDRGYVKLIQYRGERPLGEEKPYSQMVIDMKLTKSKVNGVVMWAVKSSGDCEDPGRACYTADIAAAEADGVSVYLEAENVSEDYFLNLLEIATGGEDRTEEIPLISSGKGESEEAIAREKAEYEKQAQQWESEAEIVRGAEEVLAAEWKEETEAGYGAGDLQRAADSNTFFVRDFTVCDEVKYRGDKAYNFKCIYDVAYPCDRKDNEYWNGFSLSVTRYMLLEKGADGTYVDKGLPCIEIDEGPLEELQNAGTSSQRYMSPSQCPYTARIDKSEVRGKSREDISLLLLEQLAEEMSSQEGGKGIAGGGSWLRTRDRTFLITAWKDPRIVRINRTNDDKRWIVKGDYSWKYVGYTDSYGYMGAAFPGYSREGWIDRFDQDNRFVLQELDDCYTMETLAHYELWKE